MIIISLCYKNLGMDDQNLQLLLCFLCLELREKVHKSIEMYVAKKTAYTHVISRIDLEHFQYKIENVANK